MVFGWKPVRFGSGGSAISTIHKRRTPFRFSVRGGASTSLSSTPSNAQQLDNHVHEVLEKQEHERDAKDDDRLQQTNSANDNLEQKTSSGTLRPEGQAKKGLRTQHPEVSDIQEPIATSISEKEETEDAATSQQNSQTLEPKEQDQQGPATQQIQSSQVQERPSVTKETEEHSKPSLKEPEHPSKVEQQGKQETTIQGASPTPSEEVDEAPPKPEDPRILRLIRILFLSYYASLGALMPYLPVYYHSLGHGGQIIGVLGAVKPLTTFLVAPFWGLVADQAQAPFTILKVTFAVSLVGQLLVAARNDHHYIMFMVFLTALFNAPVKSLIDGIVMDHINDRSQYGRLRLWGQMGFGLGSSGVGVMLSRSKGIVSSTATSIPESMVDSIAKLPLGIQKLIAFADKFWQCITGYRLLFLTHAALSVPTWMAIHAFQRLDTDAQNKNDAVDKNSKKVKDKEAGGARVMDGLGLLLQNTDALIFFGLIFVVGVSSGIIENFAYVRIREVGGTGKDMGLSRLVSSIAGAPMFWFSGPLTELLGADRVLVLSLLSYVVRFAIYALMRHPLHGLPAEALRGITFAAFWSTGTVYAHRISPPGLNATMVSGLCRLHGGFHLAVTISCFSYLNLYCCHS